MASPQTEHDKTKREKIRRGVGGGELRGTGQITIQVRDISTH